MPSKKSGGKRAVEKKHREREAERVRMAGGGDPREQLRARYQSLGEPSANPTKAHGWLGRVAVEVVREAMFDFALPIEQRRRDVMKFLEQASKVLDPAKLSAELEELERALEESENARAQQASANRPPSREADLL